MANLFSAGEQLQAAVIPAAMEHRILIKRGSESTEAFSASSPPVGHPVLLAEQGLIISEHDRVFFFELVYTGKFGLPRVKDVIIDLSDNSEWRVVPSQTDDAWQWHGQGRKMVQVFTKQDSINVCT